MPGLEEYGQAILPPFQYRPISIISKLFEALINKKIVEQLKRNNLQFEEQYEF